MKKLLPLLSIWLLLSCQVKPQPINYGSDACHFCKMGIVDNQHSAELVTKTGKAYKYDAIECMLNDLKEWDRPEVKLFLVADYAEPGRLIDATEASYLVSKAIPSPMGEFLSAFGEKQQRDQIQTRFGGEVYSWSELQKDFEVYTYNDTLP